MAEQSPRGTFLRIAETLRKELRSMPTGASLGSEAELSKRFGVARNTLRKALAELARENLVHSQPTKGWFVGRADAHTGGHDHVSIAAEMAEEIRRGNPAPGEHLATAPKIAAKYDVTLHTARQALITLGAQGLVESRHGKGWFVLETLPDRSTS